MGRGAALVDEVYRTCRIDDRGPMLALLSDDVVFRIEGDPERPPFTGLWHGHAGVNEHLDRSMRSRRFHGSSASTGPPTGST